MMDLFILSCSHLTIRPCFVCWFPPKDAPHPWRIPTPEISTMPKIHHPMGGQNNIVTSPSGDELQGFARRCHFGGSDCEKGTHDSYNLVSTPHPPSAIIQICRNPRNPGPGKDSCFSAGNSRIFSDNKPIHCRVELDTREAPWPKRLSPHRAPQSLPAKAAAKTGDGPSVGSDF